VHLFDIVTQYRALFSDDDPIVSVAGSAPATNRVLFSSWCAIHEVAISAEKFLNKFLSLN
jgi:hypothetical protein